MYHNGSVFNHTGLVIAVSGNSYTTIEGNTNDGSGVVAEGIGVYQRNRTLSASSGTRFARPDWRWRLCTSDARRSHHGYGIKGNQP